VLIGPTCFTGVSIYFSMLYNASLLTSRLPLCTQVITCCFQYVTNAKNLFCNRPITSKYKLMISRLAYSFYEFLRNGKLRLAVSVADFSIAAVNFSIPNKRIKLWISKYKVLCPAAVCYAAVFLVTCGL
jgi:hypothetical protein